MSSTLVAPARSLPLSFEPVFTSPEPIKVPHTYSQKEDERHVESVDKCHIQAISGAIHAIAQRLNPGHGYNYVRAYLPQRFPQKPVMIIRVSKVAEYLNDPEFNKKKEDCQIVTATEEGWPKLTKEVYDTKFSDEGSESDARILKVSEEEIAASPARKTIYPRILASVKYAFDNAQYFGLENLKQQVYQAPGSPELNDISQIPFVKSTIASIVCNTFRTFPEEASPLHRPSLWTWGDSMENMFEEELKSRAKWIP